MGGLIAKVATIAAVLFSLIWLLSTIGTGFSAPAWVPAAGLFSAAVALVIIVFGL